MLIGYRVGRSSLCGKKTAWVVLILCFLSLLFLDDGFCGSCFGALFVMCYVGWLEHDFLCIIRDCQQSRTALFEQLPVDKECSDRFESSPRWLGRLILNRYQTTRKRWKLEMERWLPRRENHDFIVFECSSTSEQEIQSRERTMTRNQGVEFHTECHV